MPGAVRKADTVSRDIGSPGMAVVGDTKVPMAAAGAAAAEGGVIVLAAVPLRWAGSAVFILAAGLSDVSPVAVVMVVRRGKRRRLPLLRRIPDALARTACRP
jgi:hypothetical protein